MQEHQLAVTEICLFLLNFFKARFSFWIKLGNVQKKCSSLLAVGGHEEGFWNIWLANSGQAFFIWYVQGEGGGGGEEPEILKFPP